MINSLTGKFFETHIDTHIEFGPGVNVIIGESDEGKSGIIRQLKWNAENRPQGDYYRNDQLDPKKKEDKLKLTEVSVDYKDSGIITRARDGFSGGVNHYQIDDGEPLRALRTDVPDEVKDVSKMKAVNIQTQHPTEQYFLLADKPGQVAKEFNKVAGLTIMDKAIKDINSQVRTCNTEIKVAKEEIETKQKEIEETTWVDDAEKLANKLKAFKAQVNKEQAEYNDLHDKINHVLGIEDVLETHYNGVDDALNALEALGKEKQSIDDEKHTVEQIEDLISAMTDVDLQLNATTDIDKALKALETLYLERQKIEKLKKEHKELDYSLCMLEKNRMERTEADIELIDAKKEYVKIFKEQECPTCGRKGI